MGFIVVGFFGKGALMIVGFYSYTIFGSRLSVVTPPLGDQKVLGQRKLAFWAFKKVAWNFILAQLEKFSSWKLIKGLLSFLEICLHRTEVNLPGHFKTHLWVQL